MVSFVEEVHLEIVVVFKVFLIRIISICRLCFIFIIPLNLQLRLAIGLGRPSNPTLDSLSLQFSQSFKVACKSALKMLKH